MCPRKSYPVEYNYGRKTRIEEEQGSVPKGSSAKLKFPIQDTSPHTQGFASQLNPELQRDGPSNQSTSTATTLSNISSRRHHAQGGGDVESDGTHHGRERDAPGQSCFYITSGDHRKEIYRLATYLRYPESVPMKCGDLAAAGFYYTGYKDRAKCFSCGMAVENWIMGDDGMDKQWHRSDCPLMNGVEYGNAPLPTPNFRTLLRSYKGLENLFVAGLASGISNQAAQPGTTNRDLTDVTTNMSQIRLSENAYPKLILANIVVPEHKRSLRRANLKSELERRQTFDKWPSYPAPYLVSDLAKEGFFYLGNLDRTQCFSCSGVLRNWAPSDSVREQHQKHFRNCRVILGSDTGNLPMSDVARRDADRQYQDRLTQLNSSSGEPPDPSPEEKIRLAGLFPCLNAINPHMVSLARRLETFDHRWPQSRIRATVQQIAKAGFFFLGESDKTKCYYCNGGLQNWDPNDEPWTEHAKWFPGCEFVLRNKGNEFVRRLAEAHPNLNRPYIRNPVSYHDIHPSEVRRTAPVESMEAQTTANPLANIDIHHVTNEMGFTRAMIDNAVSRRSTEGGAFGSTDELVQYLLDYGEELSAAPAANEVIGQVTSPAAAVVAATSGAVSPGHKREKEKESNTSIKKTKTTSLEDAQRAESLREMEEVSKCLKCKVKKRGVVFNPCGHLAVCEDCAPSIKRCMICNSKIQNNIRIYMA